MIKNTIHLIFLVIIVVSCSFNSPKSAETTANRVVLKTPVFIDLHQKSESKLNVSEFADTVMYIPLETNSKLFLKRIKQIQITDKYIFINDRDQLLIFSKEGKFIRQIGKKGKGPGEHLLIFGFVVVQDTVYISSSGNRSLLKYNVNGNFLEGLPTLSQLPRFNVTPDNRIVSYIDIIGSLVFFDRKLNGNDTIAIDHNVSDKRAIYGWWDDFDTFFQKSERRLLFTNYMSDTIWDISKGRKDIGYIMNLGDQLLPEKYRVEYCQGDFNRFKKTAAPYQKINLFETSSFLFLFQKGWIDDINSTYIHDVAANTTRKFESPYIFDDLIGKLNLVPNYTSNNCIIATLNPVELIEELKKINKQNKTGVESPSPLWLKQMAMITENSNPILVIMPVRNKTKKK